jgi:mycothiol synthase
MNVELRPPRFDELAALTNLVNRDSEELFGEREATPELIKLWLTGPKLNPETDIRVATSNGRLCGYVDIDADPDPIYWVDLRVPPSESDDVRVALMDWVEDRANERAAGNETAVIRVFEPSVAQPEKRLLEGRGYRLIRHFYRMRIELDGPLLDPEWPDSVAVRSATPGDVDIAYEVHQETFEDSWETPRQSFDEWKHWMLREGFDPSLWFLVESADAVGAVALCREREGEPGLGWVDVLGVRRPWRRQGLGRAVLLHAFHEFRRRGFHAAALGVDAESLTGANRLYESAGMRVVRQSDVYEKAL